MTQKMYDLLNEITVQVATNQPLTKSVLKAYEAGYSIVLIPATKGNPHLIRVLLVEKDEENLLTPTKYVQNHVDASMMMEYVE